MKKSFVSGADLALRIALCLVVCTLFFSSCTNFLDFAEKVNASKYTLSYVGNGSGSGDAPKPVSEVAGAKFAVADNTWCLEKKGYSVTGWNTAIDGSGISYAPGSVFTMPEKGVTLLRSGPAQRLR